MEGGVLTGEPERPDVSASRVPERVATAAADLWEAAHDVEAERDLLDKIIVDGELLILDGGQVVPADGYEPQMTGPGWNRDGHGVQDRQEHAYASAALACSTWATAAWATCTGAPLDRRCAAGRVGAADHPSECRARTGRALAKIAAVIANTSPDRITAAAGARTGVVNGAPENAAGREPITSTGVGSVPYLRPGEAVDRIKPPARMRRRASTNISLRWTWRAR